MDFTNLSLFTLGFLEKHSVPDYECTVCRDHGELLHLRHGVYERFERGFWLYSATKVFTSAAALSFSGILEVEDTEELLKYLPVLNSAAEEITHCMYKHWNGNV